MSPYRPHFAALVAGVFSVALIAGCATDSTSDAEKEVGAEQVAQPGDGVTGSEDATSPGAAEEGSDGGSEPEAQGDRPEGLDASLPVPPGTLISATPESSAWEYIYGDVTSDEARAFADQIEQMGFEVLVTVDSDGVEQWYMQSAEWAIKLEETHAEESLRYWIDPMSE